MRLRLASPIVATWIVRVRISTWLNRFMHCGGMHFHLADIFEQVLGLRLCDNAAVGAVEKPPHRQRFANDTVALPAKVCKARRSQRKSSSKM
jgi:hypothetical protein